MSQLDSLLFGLENLLLEPARRADPESIADLFAEEFCEFGKSGRTYDKSGVLEFLRTENLPARKVVIENFKVKLLCESAALATYVTVVQQAPAPETRALRSSIWVARGGRWQILFHQGTACG